MTTQWDDKDHTQLQMIGFDMGGTSTDVSRYAGRYEHVFDSTIAGMPCLEIPTSSPLTFTALPPTIFKALPPPSFNLFFEVNVKKLQVSMQRTDRHIEEVSACFSIVAILAVNKPSFVCTIQCMCDNADIVALPLKVSSDTNNAGVTIQTPQLDINTVAAGGGSRLFYRMGVFSVGPESAGAHPGPVCYRYHEKCNLLQCNLYIDESG